MLLLLALLGLPAQAQEPPADDAAGQEELPIVQAPGILEYIEAPFPAEAEEAGVEGTVLLIIELDETGAVLSVEVDEPIGYGFDEAAIEAVNEMRFSPAQTEEGPVGVAFEFAYGFVLRAEDEAPSADDAPAPGQISDVQPDDTPAPVNVTGRVKVMGTKGLLEGATVVLADTDFSTKTDEDGLFAFQGVPSGAYTLRVLSTGHITLNQPVTVEDGQVTDAQLWLRAEKYAANEVVGIYEAEKQEVTKRTLSMGEVKRIPGTFGDPVKVIQTLPGAARTPFGTGFLIIRGANPEDSGVYVDGIRIPIIYHLTGTTSVLQPDIIEQVDYLPGGYGAQYGRTMGGAIDIKTKETFDENKLTFGADVLDAQVFFQGSFPQKKGDKDGPAHGFAAGFRRSYIDAFIPIFTAGADFKIKPYYWDYQVKYVAPTANKNRGSVFVYGFQDILTFSTADERAQGSNKDTQGAIGVEYSSHRAVGSYRHSFSDTLKLSVTPSFGVDYTDFGQGEEFKLASWNTLLQLRSDLSWRPHPAVELVPGVDFLGGWFNFKFRSAFDFGLSENEETEPVLISGHGTFWSPDAYIKLNLRPANDRDRVLISPSLRLSTQIYSITGDIVDDQTDSIAVPTLDPRIAARVKLVDSLVLKAGTGLYHQPPQAFETLASAGGQPLGFERAWNSSVGFEHQISQVLQWDVEGFYRHMTRQIVITDDASAGSRGTAFANYGLGRAYGIELIIRHLPKNNFFGWISYTLSRSERQDAPDQEWYAYDFDQTHIMSAQAGYDLPFDFGVSAQIQYVTGNPQTPYLTSLTNLNGPTSIGIPSGETNSERLADYFQFSVRMDKLFTFKRWQLNTYVELLNVIKGVNPEFTVYQHDYLDKGYVRGLPFIPNIGIEAVIHL